MARTGLLEAYRGSSEKKRDGTRMRHKIPEFIYVRSIYVIPFYQVRKVYVTERAALPKEKGHLLRDLIVEMVEKIHRPAPMGSRVAFKRVQKLLT